MEGYKPKNKYASYLLRGLILNGYKPEPYSGRGMYGECVSVRNATAWELGHDGMPEPCSDQLGLSQVFYWPDATVEREE
jgi:hypothetical protein